MIDGAKEADDERTMRSGRLASVRRAAEHCDSPSSSWCMVGTAVYHVAPDCPNQRSKNTPG